MRFTSYLSGALLAATVLGGGAASAANICQADNNLTCATTMPIGGYCECTAHGNTQSGTVISKATPRERVNSTAGGCGAHPNDPGCR